MNTAKIAQTTPFAVTVESVKTYYWCSCGESRAQPFCDSFPGAHLNPAVEGANLSESACF